MGLLIPIHDGYTLDGTLAPRGRMPGVKFRYRPALAEAVFEYHRAIRDGGKVQARAAVDTLHAHLVSWDVTEKEGGDTVAITPDVLKRVPHPALLQLLDIVCGYGPEEAGADLKN